MQDSLDAYLVGLNFMARILQEAPNEPFLEQMTAFGAEVCAWPGVAADKQAKLQRAACEPRLALAEDHARLFAGPSPLAPPWESVWLEREKLLFGERTAQIARLYADWGLASAAHEPPDHLGLELAFLAMLLELASQKPEGPASTGQAALDTAKLLLGEHILQFAPALLKAASQAAQSGFYAQAAANCLAMLEQLESCLFA